MVTYLPVPTTGTCSYPLNLPHWFVFTINVLPNEKSLSMCYPLKSTCDFSVDNTLIVKKNSGREQVHVFQPGKICTDWFFHCKWVLMENCSFCFINTEHLKFILHSNYIIKCLYSNGRWNNHCSLQLWKLEFFYFENNHAIFIPALF
jgi:hypothetical protein